jgi:hypothetical protein
VKKGGLFQGILVRGVNMVVITALGRGRRFEVLMQDYVRWVPRP